MLPPKLQQIVDDIALFPDRSDRIQVLIGYAESFKQPTEEEIPTPYPEENRVPACESEVFSFPQLDENGNLNLKFGIQNPQGMSAMAIAKILQEGLNGEPPEALENVPEDVVYSLFGRELSMGKSMGLTNLIALIKSQVKSQKASS